jgi:hypothetical protein
MGTPEMERSSPLFRQAFATEEEAAQKKGCHLGPLARFAHSGRLITYKCRANGVTPLGGCTTSGLIFRAGLRSDDKRTLGIHGVLGSDSETSAPGHWFTRPHTLDWISAATAAAAARSVDATPPATKAWSPTSSDSPATTSARLFDSRPAGRRGAGQLQIVNKQAGI